MCVLKLMTFAFWCGFFASTGITMAHQDWYGLEPYIVMLRERWIDLHWLVGASIVLVAMWFYIGRRLRVLSFIEKEDDSD